MKKEEVLVLVLCISNSIYFQTAVKEEVLVLQRLDGGPVVGWQQRDCIFCSKLLFISPLPPPLLLLSDVLHTTTGGKR